MEEVGLGSSHNKLLLCCQSQPCIGLDGHTCSGLPVPWKLGTCRTPSRESFVCSPIAFKIKMIDHKDVIRHKRNGIQHKHWCDQQGYPAFLQSGYIHISPHNPKHHTIRSESNQEGNKTPKHPKKYFVNEVVTFTSLGLATKRHTESLVGQSLVGSHLPTALENRKTCASSWLMLKDVQNL